MLHNQPQIRWRWENMQTQRYYRIILAQDLFGDWILTKVWGGINKPTGRVSKVACLSYDQALQLVDTIAKARVRRGYQSCLST